MPVHFERAVTPESYAQALAHAYFAGYRIYDPSIAAARDPEAEAKMMRFPAIAAPLAIRHHDIAGRRWEVNPPDKPTKAEELLASLVSLGVGEIQGFLDARLLLARADVSGTRYAEIVRETRVETWGDGKPRPWVVPVRLVDMAKENFRFRPDNPAIGRRPKAVLEYALKRGGTIVWTKVPGWAPLVRHVIGNSEEYLGYGKGLRDVLWFLYVALAGIWESDVTAADRLGHGWLHLKLDQAVSRSKDNPNSQVVTDSLTALKKMRAEHSFVTGKDEELQFLAPPGSAADFMGKLATRLERMADRVIMGGSLFSGGGAEDTGSYARSETERDTSKLIFDACAENLEETLTRDVAGRFVKDNARNIEALGAARARRPRLDLDRSRDPDPKAEADRLEVVARIGLPVKLDEAYDLVGFSRPGPNDETFVSPQAQPQQPPQGGGGANIPFAWDESKHPRDKGRFASKHGEGASHDDEPTDDDEDMGPISEDDWQIWAYNPDPVKDALNGDLVPGKDTDSEGSPITEDDAARYKDLAFRIQDLASKSAVYCPTLWRGISFPSEKDARDAFKRNKLVTFPTLTSTATQKDIAVEYANHGDEPGSWGDVPVLMRIESSTGTHQGVQTRPIFGVRSAEVVMPKGTEYRVVRVYKDEDTGILTVTLYTKKKPVGDPVDARQPDDVKMSAEWDESQHPRDDHGRFVSKEDLAAAASDPAKAEELRARVTDPEQRKRLEEALAAHGAAGGESKAEPPATRARPEGRDERIPDNGGMIEVMRNGDLYRVRVWDDGFELVAGPGTDEVDAAMGVRHKSLTALAKVLTGAKTINGIAWFKLGKKDPPAGAASAAPASYPVTNVPQKIDSERPHDQHPVIPSVVARRMELSARQAVRAKKRIDEHLIGDWRSTSIVQTQFRKDKDAPNGYVIDKVPFSAGDFHDRVMSAPVKVNIQGARLGKLFKKGRFISGYERGGSKSRDYLETRQWVEENMFGEAAKDAIYGALQIDGIPDDASAYGQVACVLKSKNVRHRTSYTWGDSFCNFQGQDESVAATIAFGDDGRRAVVADSVFRKTIPPDYVEAQIHGGVTVDDIDHLEIDATRLLHTIERGDLSLAIDGLRVEKKRGGGEGVASYDLDNATIHGKKIRIVPIFGKVPDESARHYT